MYRPTSRERERDRGKRRRDKKAKYRPKKKNLLFHSKIQCINRSRLVNLKNCLQLLMSFLGVAFSAFSLGVQFSLFHLQSFRFIIVANVSRYKISKHSLTHSFTHIHTYSPVRIIFRFRVGRGHFFMGLKFNAIFLYVLHICVCVFSISYELCDTWSQLEWA